MRKLALAIAVGALCFTGPAVAQSSGPDSPTLTNDNPSSCLGAERASRNSAGGDREHGEFGEAQAAFVQFLNEGGQMSYGEFLIMWMATCEDAPAG